MVVILTPIVLKVGGIPGLMLCLNFLPEFDLHLFLFRHSRIEYLHFQ